jgi:hypothetical protein
VSVDERTEIYRIEPLSAVIGKAGDVARRDRGRDPLLESAAFTCTARSPIANHVA